MTKFLEERCKLIYKVVFINPKQDGSDHENSQMQKMKKDERKYIIIDVVTEIGDSDSNANNSKT